VCNRVHNVNFPRVIIADHVCQVNCKSAVIVAAGKGVDVMLARQTLLNCGAFHGFGNGCDGGDPIDVCECLTSKLPPCVHR
jgi:hypothetical protein